MTDIQAHLKAIQAWLDQVDQTPLPASPEEKQQLQAVNKAVEQLTKLGVEIPSDLRSLKLRLSASEVAAVSNPLIAKQLAALESLIDGLRDLLRNGMTIRQKLKPESNESGSKKMYGVTLKQLFDAGFVSTEDRLQHQTLSGVYEAKILSDGLLSAKTDQGWKTFNSLSEAASELIGRRQRNGWVFWRRINANGTSSTLNEIRAQYLKADES